MSTESNIATVRRYFDAFNGNAVSLDTIIDAECMQYDPATPLPGKGIEQTRHLHTMYRTSFPDLTFHVTDIFGAGDRVAACWTATGTQRGELMGMPPSGLKGEVTGTSIFRLKDGKLAEIRVNWDTLGLLRQLGVLPIPAESEA